VGLCQRLFKPEVCSAADAGPRTPSLRKAGRRSPATDCFLAALEATLSTLSEEERSKLLVETAVGQSIVARFDASAIGRPVLNEDVLMEKVDPVSGGRYFSFDAQALSRFSREGRDRTVTRAYVEDLQGYLPPEIGNQIVFRWNEIYDLQDLDKFYARWAPRPRGTTFDIVLPGKFKADAMRAVQELNAQLRSSVPPLRDLSRGVDWRLEASRPRESQVFEESQKDRLFACKRPSDRADDVEYQGAFDLVVF